MWLHSWTISTPSASSPSQTPWAFINPRKPHNAVLAKPFFFPKTRPSIATTIRAQFSEEITQLVHNKVLIAAGVSAAIGQLSKPFTSVILYGKEFDIKAAIQAGGFPSTHSSAVVAAATCLGLERGFSDSIFGLTVVYAGLIMYDAQGVRREVGIHARTLNKLLKAKSRENSTRARDIDGFDSQSGTSSPLNYLSSELSSSSWEMRNALLVPKSENKTEMENPSGLEDDIEEGLEGTPNYSPLKESIGHTEVEVIAGALFGFLRRLGLEACGGVVVEQGYPDSTKKKYFDYNKDEQTQDELKRIYTGVLHDVVDYYSDKNGTLYKFFKKECFEINTANK